jgi:spore germination protein GerM
MTVTIYCVESGEHGPMLAARSIQVPPDRRPMEYALSAMADLPDSPLPAGTQVLSTTIADSGIATVDFNRALRDSFHGSAADEVMAVDSLRMVMGQFPGVDQVQVTIEGQEIPSIGGNVDLSKPVDVIRPGPSKYYHRQPRYHRKWHWS